MYSIVNLRFSFISWIFMMLGLVGECYCHGWSARLILSIDGTIMVWLRGLCKRGGCSSTTGCSSPERRLAIFTWHNRDQYLPIPAILHPHAPSPKQTRVVSGRLFRACWARYFSVSIVTPVIPLDLLECR